MRKHYRQFNVAAALPPVIMGGKAALHTAAFSHLALQDGLRYAQMAKMRR